MQEEEENSKKIQNEINTLSNLSYSDFWIQVKKINILFKELKPLAYNDRQTLWSEFSSICEKVKENYSLICRNNASEIQNKLHTLSSIRAATWNNYLARYRNYSQFWKWANEISGMFKNLKPLNRDDREDLWKKFSELCNDVKDEQVNYRKNFESGSKEHYNTIMGRLHYAVPDSANVDELKDHGRYLTQARQLLTEYKNDMTFSHKKECFERIQEIQRQMDAWWEHVKSDRQRHHDDFLVSVRANLEKNIERHRKATNSLEYLQEKQDELQSRIDSAWNDNWISKASGWMSEFEDKIRNTEDYIRKIEDWIDEDERKLR